MRRLITILALALSQLIYLLTPVQAMDGGYGEFQRLMTTPLRVLTEKANRILLQKYDDNQFGGSPEIAAMLNCLPNAAINNPSAAVAYRIADKRPDLLASHTCYDPSCEERKYRNLLDAFLKTATPGNYNDHAASCPTCYSEAILIFLWSETGASQDDINGGLRYLFDPSVHESPAITP